MNISAIQSNNQLNFEACYVNRNGIKRSFGKTILNQVESIFPEIEKKSVDVDTFIFPDKFGIFNRKNGITVRVQKLNISFWDKILSHLSLRPPYSQEGFVLAGSIMDETVGLLARFEDAKQSLTNYI